MKRLTLPLMSDAVRELIGVYDADATFIGEITYWLKARIGSDHCELCDLTHGIFRIKHEWVDFVESLNIPFNTFHRNDAPTEVVQVIDEYPALLARTDGGLKVVFSKHHLNQFSGETSEFIKALKKLLAQY